MSALHFSSITSVTRFKLTPPAHARVFTLPGTFTTSERASAHAQIFSSSPVTNRNRASTRAQIYSSSSIHKKKPSVSACADLLFQSNSQVETERPRMRVSSLLAHSQLVTEPRRMRRSTLPAPFASYHNMFSFSFNTQTVLHMPFLQCFQLLQKHRSGRSKSTSSYIR